MQDEGQALKVATEIAFYCQKDSAAFKSFRRRHIYDDYKKIRAAQISFPKSPVFLNIIQIPYVSSYPYAS